MRKITVLACLCTSAIALTLSGCRRDTVTLSSQRLAYPGLHTFPTPRTFDGPGTVFRIDRQGRKFPVAKLDVKVDDAGNEWFADYSRTLNWTLTAFAEFVGAADAVQNADAKLVRDANVVTTIKLGQGRRSRTYDADIVAALTKSGIPFNEGNRYYVVREAIAVPSITYVFRNVASLSSEAKATVHRIAAARGQLERQSAEQTTLVQTFDTPYFIFYTADAVVPPGTGMSAGNPPKLIPLETPPAWVAEATKAE